MFNRFALLALGLISVGALGPVSISEAASGKVAKSGKVEGVLVGVASNGVVIKNQAGTLVSVGVTAATKVELNGVRVSVTSLPVGARAQALFDTATNVATKVEARK